MQPVPTEDLDTVDRCEWCTMQNLPGATHCEACAMPLKKSQSESLPQSVAAIPVDPEDPITATRNSSSLRLEDLEGLPLEFFRRQLLRTAVVNGILGLLCLYFSPLVGLMLTPTACIVVFWLVNAFRFQHGGDVRRCMNRDCAIMFYFMACLVSIGILCINVIYTIYMLSTKDSASKTTTTTTVDTDGGDVYSTVVPSTTHHSHRSSTTVYMIKLFFYLAMILTVSYSSYCAKRLRDILKFP